MNRNLGKKIEYWKIANSHYGVNPVNTKPEIKEYYMNNITKVIFNNPATIVFWRDSSKTVVKCNPEDTFDPEKGLAMACMKKLFGNHGFYNDIFRKWLFEEGNEKSLYPKHPNDVLDAVNYSAASIVTNSGVFKNALQAASRVTFEELEKLANEDLEKREQVNV